MRAYGAKATDGALRQRPTSKRSAAAERCSSRPAQALATRLWRWCRTPRHRWIDASIRGVPAGARGGGGRPPGAADTNGLVRPSKVVGVEGHPPRSRRDGPTGSARPRCASYASCSRASMQPREPPAERAKPEEKSMRRGGGERWKGNLPAGGRGRPQSRAKARASRPAGPTAPRRPERARNAEIRRHSVAARKEE